LRESTTNGSERIEEQSTLIVKRGSSPNLARVLPCISMSSALLRTVAMSNLRAIEKIFSSRWSGSLKSNLRMRRIVSRSRPISRFHRHTYLERNASETSPHLDASCATSPAIFPQMMLNTIPPPVVGLTCCAESPAISMLG